MNWFNALIILFTGFAAGFINTIAGGGSLLALPVLIFLGLPSSVANATNRVAIFLQNVSGVAGFKSKGISAYPYSLWLGISALLGAIIGAKLAVDIKGDLFNKILAIVMVVVILLTIFNPGRSKHQLEEKMNVKARFTGILIFFFIGIYGGFIQAGVGFLIIASLTSINRFSLVKTNSAKVFVILIYTSAALVVFILENKINWTYGLVLAAGNASGAWIGSRWSVDKGDKWIKRILVVTVIALATKLWFFS
ncbi:MAG: sulfite exporter TauE/SafE family protein [Candidatus Cyclobacteriaceae bacterium M3_2C_046]